MALNKSLITGFFNYSDELLITDKSILVLVSLSHYLLAVLETLTQLLSNPPEIIDSYLPPVILIIELVGTSNVFLRVPIIHSTRHEPSKCFLCDYTLLLSLISL